MLIVKIKEYFVCLVKKYLSYFLSPILHCMPKSVPLTFSICWNMAFGPWHATKSGVIWNKFQITFFYLRIHQNSLTKGDFKTMEVKCSISSMICQFSFYFLILVQLCSKLPLSSLPICPKQYQFTPPRLLTLFCFLPRYLGTLHENKCAHWKLDNLLYHISTWCGNYNLQETYGTLK